MEKREEKRRGGNTVKRMGSDQVLREFSTLEQDVANASGA